MTNIFLILTSFRDKKAIPPGIAPSTQVLDLRGNDIRVLHNNAFLQLGITNLQRIYCSYCDIGKKSEFSTWSFDDL